MLKITETGDGSNTIYVPELDEHYHSVHGAVQESEHVFLKTGFDFCQSNPVRVFEVGFGTGLNALLTAIRSLKGERDIYYTTIEKYPLSNDIVKVLNYYRHTSDREGSLFNMIHNAPWGKMEGITDRFSLLKINGDLMTEEINGEFDLIYFDAFGPDKQPAMWSYKIIEMLAASLRAGGIFVTYSVKGELKRNLRSLGFEVTLLPGPPGKRQILRAVKI